MHVTEDKANVEKLAFALEELNQNNLAAAVRDRGLPLRILVSVDIYLGAKGFLSPTTQFLSIPIIRSKALDPSTLIFDWEPPLSQNLKIET